MTNYEDIVFREARFYGVEISDRRTKRSNDVRYWAKVKRIQIPIIIDIEALYHCLSCISRYSVLKTKPVYLHTYKRFMWTFERLNHYGIDTTPYLPNAKRRVMYDLTTYNNKKGDMDKLNSNVKEFLSDLEPDFTSWKGMYVSLASGTPKKSPYQPIAKAVEKRKATKRARIAKMFNKDDNE